MSKSVPRDPATGLPARFVARLERIVPEDALQCVLDGLCQDRGVSFRVNTLRAEAAAVFAALEAEGIQFTRVAWFAEAGLLTTGSVRDLQQSGPHQRGELFIQGLASMTAPLALEPKPGEAILDLCAAPGGKTTLLACLMNGSATDSELRLHANDGSRSRVYKLRAVLEQQGVQGAVTTARQGQGFGRSHAGVFDAVLLDAPCSAEARQHPDSEEHWTARRIPRLAGLQTRLLESAVAATRPGGRILYATCTFAPEENEAVVNRVLLRHAGCLALEELPLPLPPALPGLTQWGRKSFHADLALSRRLLPGPGVEGFYLALLRKHEAAAS